MNPGVLVMERSHNSLHGIVNFLEVPQVVGPAKTSTFLGSLLMGFHCSMNINRHKVHKYINISIKINNNDRRIRDKINFMF